MRIEMEGRGGEDACANLKQAHEPPGSGTIEMRLATGGREGLSIRSDTRGNFQRALCFAACGKGEGWVMGDQTNKIETKRVEDKRAEEKTETRDAWQMEDTQALEVSVPAIRHIGPTLESDPGYLELVGSGGPTPEAQIAEEAATAEPDVRELLDEGIDPLSGHEAEAGEPEPLKTRLPGDTSSDPHTDVGPDNATAVQRRGEQRHAA